ncbi:MAG: hypothetical protein KAW12_24510 [Candidatus Aminicenantes bacterium]|nr:hypothetical protein [Candidatus Aminicenantes bacterium]
MLKIDHIINPVQVKETSDLFIAQPVTFETMRISRRTCAPEIEVSLLSTQYPEDRSMIPADFEAAPDLERSVPDVHNFRVHRKLPLIKDILDRLYQHGSGDYLIYTNVDIALQPYFYQTAAGIIEQGYDAFVINRRTIPAAYKSTREIPLMYSEIGEKHKGWDCFIFRRDLYPRFDLRSACIGSGWIGRVLLTNLAALAKKFHIFTDLHVTFHVGNEQSWKTGILDDYRMFNRSQCREILLTFEQKYGPFDRRKIPGRFWRKLEPGE